MTSQEKRTLVAKFRIEGNLRFLSHQETMTMWSRVLARSGLDVCFSSGYNPHPRLSLPLPRSVGVRSDDELLCATIFADDSTPLQDLASNIRECLPDGCVVTEVELYPGVLSFRPAEAIYELALQSPAEEEVHHRVGELNARAAAGEAIIVQRQSKNNGPPSRIDVGAYIASAAIAGDRVAVNCRITPAGTVRVDEIMQLLGLETKDIPAGVLRKSVQWERN